MRTLNQRMKPINHTLNVLKCLACTVVVLIHVRFPGRGGDIIASAATWAVPFFILISGYFAYGASPRIILKRLKKVSWMLCYGYFAFLIFNIAVHLHKGTFRTWLAASYTWKTPIKMIMFCTVDFAIPLWYLIAMIETYCLWLLLLKHHKEYKALRWIPFLVIVSILSTVFLETMGFAWYLNFTFVARALPWFLIGYYLHTQTGKRWAGIPTALILFSIFLGLLIMAAPLAFGTLVQFGYIGVFPCAIGLFILGLKYPMVTVPELIEFMGSKLSANVYVFHPVLSSCITFCLTNINSVHLEGTIYPWIHPIVTVIISFLFSWLLFWLKSSFRRCVFRH